MELSHSSQEVLKFAKEEALRFNHNYLGTEHLLLGIVRQKDGTAARVLTNMGVDLRKIRSAVDFVTGPREGAIIDEPRLTPRAKTVLNLARQEAEDFRRLSIETEHILLAILLESGGIACGVLEALGVSSPKLREYVEHSMEEQRSFGRSHLKALQEVVNSLSLSELGILLQSEQDCLKVLSVHLLIEPIAPRPYAIAMAQAIAQAILMAEEEKRSGQ